MSKAWIRAKRCEFARDVLRDFCLASRELEHIFLEYETVQKLDFNSLRTLTGEEMDKGLLWRLKDTAHHLFRNNPASDMTGKFLDWGLGYIFHETIKLKEDSYQLSHYAPWFIGLDEESLPEHDKVFRAKLLKVLMQTRESIDREMRRIRYIMGLCQEMFPAHYIRYKGNALLARFLVAQDTLVRAVFKERFEGLVKGVYGEQPELMWLLAAKSLRQGGWLSEAESAIEQALATNPQSAAVQAEKQLIERLDEQIRKGLPIGRTVEMVGDDTADTCF